MLWSVIIASVKQLGTDDLTVGYNFSVFSWEIESSFLAVFISKHVAIWYLIPMNFNDLIWTWFLLKSAAIQHRPANFLDDFNFKLEGQ